jgi:acetyl esterase/lipase
MQEQPTYRYDGLYQYPASRGVGVLAPNIRGSAGYGASYQDLTRSTPTASDSTGSPTARSSSSLSSPADQISTGQPLSISADQPTSSRSSTQRLPSCAPLSLNRSATPTRTGTHSRPDLRSLTPDQVRTPLLVIGGAEDTRVPRSESDQLVEQLHAHGIEVDYDLIPGEGHGFTQRANGLRARSTAADFLIRHLAPRWSGT